MLAAMPLDIRNTILQVLMSKAESYGLEIIDTIKSETGGKMTAPQGRVYPALRELEAEGFLESFEGPPLPERGGRPRRYYRITALGKRVARDEARAVYPLLKTALGRA